MPTTQQHVLAQAGGPAVPSTASCARHLPLEHGDATVASGLWAHWQRVNQAASIPLGLRKLDEAGNLRNLQIAAGEATGTYRGPVYMDSDVYKMLETAAWELGRHRDDALEAFLVETTALLERAQQEDGYLNSHYQVAEPGRRYTRLENSHELYCAGHLMQAATAAARCFGDERLLGVARRFADHLVKVYLHGDPPGLDGHPQVETALVELFRLTGEQSYLELAKRHVDDRGRGLAGHSRRGSEYFQDHAPVRDAPIIVGHAVRALYLEAGIVDVYLETGDESLLAASERRWDDMVAARTALTGGHGTRLLGEAFGERYELPPDLAYNETCAAVASIHWAWRLLLATGNGRYADLIERTLYNGFAAATSADGLRFFKGNPLQRRRDHVTFEEPLRRRGWFFSACCPPNVTRLVSSLQHYVATTTAEGLYVHQYTAGTLATRRRGGVLEFDVQTDYPWDGAIVLTVRQAPEEEVVLGLRIPPWSATTRLLIGAEEHLVEPNPDGYLTLKRAWRQGEVVTLHLDMNPRLTYPHPRVDALRGCVALERGPLVYCFEQQDQQAGIDIDTLTLAPGADLEVVHRPDLPGIGRTVTIGAGIRTSSLPHSEGLPYFPRPPETVETATQAVAIPYFQWDNRDDCAMRLWVPAAQS
ncbi:glycoside hydrolase family 127 protein [Actinopolymorpha alba]|uniref:glycoside hydrolase family 127 protein n=1 Tax=Actinopolymorpha alba TaxID=533267 RepID=UPI000365CDD2|nr:beta-L-arabinofuranosidase domain-containing protein [Actinopolymorpha alba]